LTKQWAKEVIPDLSGEKVVITGLFVDCILAADGARVATVRNGLHCSNI
jgi:hypothetical protein